MNTLKTLMFLSVLFLLVNTLASPLGTTYQARIVKPNGYPLEASGINFQFTILDPSEACVLYSESFSNINMQGSGGLISFSLGSGIPVYNASGTVTFSDVLNNANPLFTCQDNSTYSPLAHDIRKIVMQFMDASGWQTLPAMAINAVPYAIYSFDAQRLGGVSAGAFVRQSMIPTCTASEAITYTNGSFSCVGAGSLTSITSSDVTNALGYTPIDESIVQTSFTTVVATTNSLITSTSTLAASYTVLASTVGDLATSFSTLVSSQWVTSGTSISYNSGNVGIGIENPLEKLAVSGAIRAKGFIESFEANSASMDYYLGNTRFYSMGPDSTTRGGFLFRQLASDGSQSLIPLAISSNGNIGMGTTIPTAKLQIVAGTSSIAPLKFTSGTLLSSPQSGTIEYDGSQLYFTDGTNTRRALASTSTPGSFDNTSSISNSGGNIVLAPNNTTGSVVVSATTPSTNSGTGALVVNGGLGVAGNVNSAGSVNAVSLTAISGITTPAIYGTTNLLLNPTGGNVGIGTNNPTSLLHIQNPAATANVNIEGLGASSNSQLNFNSNGEVASIIQNQVNNIFGLRNASSGDVHLAINQTGNIGIGTISPESKLHILGASTSGLIISDRTENDSSVANALWMRRGNGTGVIATLGTEGNGANGVSAVTIGLGVTSATVVERLRINANGNIGIGTNTPLAQLQIGQSTLTGSPSSTTESRRLAIATNTHTGATFDIYERDEPGTANLDFRYSGSSVSGTLLTLVHNGNVGIGTAYPTEKLTLSKELNGDTLMNIANANSSGALARAGIALTNSGTAYGSNSAGLFLGGVSHSTMSNQLHLFANSGISSGVVIGASNPSASIVFSTQNIERMRIAAGGNIGIGTKSPLYQLDVSGSIRGNQIFGNLQNQIFYSNGELLHGVNASGTPETDTSSPFYRALPEGVNGGVYSWWNYADSIGEPTNTGQHGAGIGFGRGTGGSVEIWGGWTGEGFLYTRFLRDCCQGWSDWKKILIENSAGNVGIGTNSPQDKVHVASSLNAGSRVRVTNSSSGSAAVAELRTYSDIETGGFAVGSASSNFSSPVLIAGDNYIYSNSRPISITNATAQPIKFNINSSEQMRIASTGNVGIGTTAPSEKLHVAGNARIQGSVTDCYIGNGSGGTSCSSDARLKENIKPIPFALEKINSLKGVEFNWNILSPSYGRKDLGVIAQDVEKVFPSAVMTGSDGYKKVDYAVLVAPLIQAVKELYEKLINQDRQIASIVETKADQTEIEKLKLENEKQKLENQQMKQYLCSKDSEAPFCR